MSSERVVDDIATCSWDLLLQRVRRIEAHDVSVVRAELQENIPAYAACEHDVLDRLLAYAVHRRGGEMPAFTADEAERVLLVACRLYGEITVPGIVDGSLRQSSAGRIVPVSQASARL